MIHGLIVNANTLLFTNQNYHKVKENKLKKLKKITKSQDFKASAARTKYRLA